MSDSDDYRAIRAAGIELGALANSGIAYSHNEFDTARYHQVLDIANRLLGLVARQQNAAAPLPKLLVPEIGYATPKIDVRGAVFNARGEVALVREVSDGLWTLPGGWADVLESPSAAVEREVREELGLAVKAEILGMAFDMEAQGHLPRLPFHVYKLFFVCSLAPGQEPQNPDAEISEVGWFAPDRLPDLSLARVHASEIDLLWKYHCGEIVAASFD